ncbi:MAG TPA: hypothetical protein VGW38_21180, partial [Chloroflexota bacterium]|nr:hypothetical protein [Chloroflexota bacterium]
LHTNFREGERLEDAYDWVPKVRTRMRASQPRRSVLRRVIWFYIGGVTAALAVAAGASLLLLAQVRYSAPAILAAAIAWGAVAVALAYVLYRTTLDAQEPEQQSTPALGDSASTVVRPVAPAK